MMRQAIRGLVLLGLLALLVDSPARAQNAVPDKVTIRDRKDGTIKTVDGQFKVGPAGFQVVGGEKLDKVVATVAPDDVVKVAIGDLAGVDRPAISGLNTKEDQKDYDAVRTGYLDLFKKSASAPERTKRYLKFKAVTAGSKIVDGLDPDKGWKEKADAAITEWKDYLTDFPTGWEQWPAVRASTRLQIERGKHEDAARSWAKLSKSPDLPPDAKLEAALQEIDLEIRAKKYSAVLGLTSELLKSAAGAKKDRLVIYEIAARAGSDGKPLDGIDKIKAEMNKTKDASVHTTGFSMLGELYLAGGKPRDALWEFAMVETVLNQDRDEVLKAMSRLAEMFEAQGDKEQEAKCREKLKRLRATF